MPFTHISQVIASINKQCSAMNKANLASAKKELLQVSDFLEKSDFAYDEREP